MNPLARGIEELLPEGMPENIWCFLLLRTALVASSVCAAFLIPFFGKNVKLMKFFIISLKTHYCFGCKLGIRSCDGSDRIYT